MADTPPTDRKLDDKPLSDGAPSETITGVEAAQHVPTRRDFIHVAAGAAAVGGAAMIAWPLVHQMNPAADTLALASIDVDLSKVVAGQQITVKWRGKPLFVRNRTPVEIQRAQQVRLGELKDPQPDAERVKQGNEQWLILVGSCTHLGCVPTFGTGDYGGWFCPCHGSHYDTSGRIRKGPAPLNLAVPEYEFLSPTSVRVG